MSLTRPTLLLGRHAMRYATKLSAPPTPNSRRLLNTIPTCPSATCACAATPSMPDSLPIDQTAPLNGLIASYAEQVLICTGRSDWPSRIEDDNSGDNLAADLKELMGRGGQYSDPFNNVSVLASSFPASPAPSSVAKDGVAGKVPPGTQSVSAYLLPSFTYVPFLPRVSFEAVQALVHGYLLPEKLHPAHDGLSPIHRDRLTRQVSFRALLPGVRPVRDVLVLICGHGGRDERCGIMGPVLQSGFETQLAQRGFEVHKDPVPWTQEGGDDKNAAASITEGKQENQVPPTPPIARVGLISHVGGHKFAGNVIVYLPPTLETPEGAPHPLRGHGVWYGRVEPRHVEGLLEETVVKGNVVKDMFRGAIDQDRNIIRL